MIQFIFQLDLKIGIKHLNTLKVSKDSEDSEDSNDSEDSKRCKEALTSQLTASKCGDITELINKESSKTGTQRTTMLKCCDEMSSVFSKRRDCVSWKPG